ncbi:hypothetical protein [Phytohabitans kaempferiae]|uniref:Uncharacterized protein n=1 Tax=Phytohabitans kaempferiae TaxID=1620943 RepID=A0ABV6MCL8_9ACTN
MRRVINRLVVPVLAALVVLGTGGPAFADAQPGGKLFVGGSFGTAGATTATSIAAWDGVDWSGLVGPNGEGADSTVTAMTMYNGKLIVGGSFIEAGGETVSGIASWDGTDWEPFVSPSGAVGVTVAPLGFVSSLVVYNGDLYAGGMFPRAGGTVDVNNIARWNGAEWFALPGPSGAVGTENHGSVIAPVWDLTVVDGLLIAAGEFTSIGGVAVNSVGAWNGTTWSSLNQPIADATIMAVTSFNGRLVASRSYVVDNFNVGDVVWRDGGQWSVLGGDPQGRMNGSPRDLIVHNGNLIAGGEFTQAAGITVNRVAQWNGSAWSALSGPSGTGASGTVHALASHAGFLFVGGAFGQAGGVTANNIARWNGSAWSALAGSANGTDSIVLELLST